MSRDCCVAFPHDATSLSAVRDCGISRSYSLTTCIFLCLAVSDKTICPCFPCISLCKTYDPTFFDPEGILSRNLVETYQMLLHTKYQDSRHFGFRSGEFEARIMHEIEIFKQELFP